MRIYASRISPNHHFLLLDARRLKNNLYILDELIQLYSYAEDLDTYEHAAKELSTFLAGPVSTNIITPQESTFLTESDKRTGL